MSTREWPCVPQKIRGFHKEPAICKSSDRRDLTRKGTMPIHGSGNCKMQSKRKQTGLLHSSDVVNSNINNCKKNATQVIKIYSFNLCCLKKKGTGGGCLFQTLDNTEALI